MELRLRLKQKGHAPAAIAAALARLAEVEVQSDERFAERYASSGASRGRSARLIQSELRARGVAPELAAAASASSPEAERERALAFARARAARMSGLDLEAARRRLAGQLARRGYDADTCRSVADEALGRENLDPSSGPDVP